MTGTAAWLGEHGRALRATWDLVHRLDEGNALPCLVRAAAAPGEQVHVDVTVTGWWYGGVDVYYQDRGLLDLTSPAAFTMTAGATAVANRRTRRVAEALAAPQWRPLGHGPTHAVMTDQRLTLNFDQQARSFWYAGGLDVAADLSGGWLVVTGPDQVPLGLTGPWAPYLAVALTHRLYGEIPVLDGLDPAVDHGPRTDSACV